MEVTTTTRTFETHIYESRFFTIEQVIQALQEYNEAYGHEGEVSQIHISTDLNGKMKILTSNMDLVKAPTLALIRPKVTCS